MAPLLYAICKKFYWCPRSSIFVLQLPGLSFDSSRFFFIDLRQFHFDLASNSDPFGQFSGQIRVS
jgi:hypothetical protein